MTDIMLLNITPAISLRQSMSAAADNLDFDAHALMEPLTEASELLGGSVPDVIPGMQRIASDLRSSADDLNARIQIVLAGGSEMNSGLAALERIKAKFTLIETRGNSHKSDGKLSLGDLKWARHHLDEETSAAAAWLEEHKEFFARVETAKDNNSYINLPYDNKFAYNPEDTDGELRIRDIDAFFAKTEAWAKLLPYASLIDTAYDGGDADGRLTKKDFQAFVSDYDISEDVLQAANKVIRDGAYHQRQHLLSKVLTWGQCVERCQFRASNRGCGRWGKSHLLCNTPRLALGRHLCFRVGTTTRLIRLGSKSRCHHHQKRDKSCTKNWLQKSHHINW